MAVNPTIAQTNFTTSDKVITVGTTVTEKNDKNVNVKVDSSRNILKVDITTMRTAINNLFNYAANVNNCNCKTLDRNTAKLCQSECKGGSNTLTITGNQTCQKANKTPTQCSCQKTKTGSAINQSCQVNCSGSINQSCQTMSYLKSQCTDCVCDCNCNCQCSDSDSDTDTEM